VKPLALLPLLVLACSGGAGTERAGPWVPPEGDLDGRRGAWGAAGGEGGTAGAAAGAFVGSVVCVEGEARECLVQHQLANGVPTCWEGVRVCVAGRWGPCEAPPEEEEWTVIERAR